MNNLIPGFQADGSCDRVGEVKGGGRGAGETCDHPCFPCAGLSLPGLPATGRERQTGLYRMQTSAEALPDVVEAAINTVQKTGRIG